MIGRNARPEAVAQLDLSLGTINASQLERTRPELLSAGASSRNAGEAVANVVVAKGTASSSASKMGFAGVPSHADHRRGCHLDAIFLTVFGSKRGYDVFL